MSGNANNDSVIPLHTFGIKSKFRSVILDIDYIIGFLLEMWCTDEYHRPIHHNCRKKTF